VEWVETTAKTVEAAKELALDQLHVDEVDAEFVILEEPRQGLFGRTKGEARIKARVRPVQPRPKAERRDRRRPSRKGRGQSESRSSGQAGSQRDDDTTEREDDAGEPRSNRNRRRSRSRSQSGTGGDTGGSRSDEGQAQQRGSQRQNQPSRRAAPVSEESTVNDDDVTVEEQAEIVQGFVEGLVDAFGYDAEVTSVAVDDETIEIQVGGTDLGLLVGPRGNTLQAIHDLSRTVVQRQAAGTHHGRVRLDIAGYRERRREALERFTQKVAEQALSTGVAQVLEPMSAADRKVVHDTANEIDGVHTISEGEDARRHVVVVPDEG
jgi:spoIIIJ-associated protein